MRSEADTNGPRGFWLFATPDESVLGESIAFTGNVTGRDEPKFSNVLPTVVYC